MGLLSRAVIATAAAGLAGAVGCAGPEIGPGSYFCGPERLCPPDQECDDSSFTCVRPTAAQPFACPDGAEVAEPDATTAEAADAGELACGASLVTDEGCIAPGDDTDVVGFTFPSACTGTDPHLAVTLRFPLALVPLRVELLDADGNPLAAGEDCTPGDNFSGKQFLCIEQTLEAGSYFLRVTIDPDGADCGGDCRYNRYTLDVVYPLA